MIILNLKSLRQFHLELLLSLQLLLIGNVAQYHLLNFRVVAEVGEVNHGLPACVLVSKQRCAFLEEKLRSFMIPEVNGPHQRSFPTL